MSPPIGLKLALDAMRALRKKLNEKVLEIRLEKEASTPQIYRSEIPAKVC
jgi:hypothetical protein